MFVEEIYNLVRERGNQLNRYLDLKSYIVGEKEVEPRRQEEGELGRTRKLLLIRT